LIVATPFAYESEAMLGALGGSSGVTGVTDGAEDGLGPCAFVAVTVKVYAVPSVRPVMVHGLVLQLALRFPGEEVTVYCVIASPPSLAGAVMTTVADCPAAVTEAMLGALGRPTGVTLFDCVEDVPLPTEFTAATVNA
jgi:hypothetical protein